MKNCLKRNREINPWIENFKFSKNSVKTSQLAFQCENTRNSCSLKKYLVKSTLAQYGLRNFEGIEVQTVYYVVSYAG